uniref:ATP synthase subunit 9, mitochondrial n=1 Tax=Euplotes vanleeuwenhoeki TaxID=2794224 RepID=A0A7T1FUQ8_9SPIT|nr:ATP synthase subunit c [Euplotes vanleeuwenhoeki]QPM99265.1 ATP synthase subunit c [Euplotes vanleeuwenhoeki]
MLFVKAAKALALGVVMLPIAGCAIGTGIIFAALIRGLAYAPDQEETLFNYTTLGFAFVETFAFMLFGVAMLIYIF